MGLGLGADVDENDQVVRTQGQCLEKGALLVDAVDQEDHGRSRIGALFDEDVPQLIDAAPSVDELGDQTQISIHGLAFTPSR